MKTKTYYIVREYDSSGDRCFRAYKEKLFWFRKPYSGSSFNAIVTSYHTANDCEIKLKKVLRNQNIKPKLVRVVEI